MKFPVFSVQNATRITPLVYNPTAQSPRQAREAQALVYQVAKSRLGSYLRNEES